jgi:hypothetical protein
MERKNEGTTRGGA